MSRRWYLIGLIAIASAIIGTTFVPKKRVNSDIIRIGILKHESSLPFYFADENGLFRASGVQVALVELPPGDHMPALLSGRVDMISPTSFPVLFGVMSQNAEALYALFPGAELIDGPTVYGLVVRSDFTGQNILDLRGKAIMAINTFTQINIQAILEAVKIPRPEWPQIRVASREVALQAVSENVAQAAIMDQPALAVAAERSDIRVIERNLRARYLGSPYWSGAGAILRHTWRDRQSDIRRVLTAIDAANDAVRLNSTGAHQLLAKKLELPISAANKMGGYFYPKSTDDVPLDGIAGTIRALTNAKLLDGEVPLNDIFPPATYHRR